AEPQWSGDPWANGSQCGTGCCGAEGPRHELLQAFLGQNEPLFLPNYYDPFSSQQFAYGCVTTTPYRLGWNAYRHAVYIPSVSTSGVSGKFQSTELNGSMRYATLLNEGLLFAGTGSWNTRYWSGPTGIAMPPYVSQFIADFQLSSLDPGPWNWMIGVTPQLSSDFQRQLTSDAYMVDARAVLFNKISPQLTLAIGAAYWDRANNYFIPYGGLIWTPDDRWEVRAMFPKSRVSYYIGNTAETDIWLYGAGEYNVEAYQIDFDDATRLKDRGEFRDYRLLLGLNAQRRRWTAFFEGGYILDRHVEFQGKTPGFGIDDAWILRAGISY
ncbi:MAG: hypothetical protein V4719_20105, partial [Planctomycetota bacterium]